MGVTTIILSYYSPSNKIKWFDKEGDKVCFLIVNLTAIDGGVFINYAVHFLMQIISGSVVDDTV